MTARLAALSLILIVACAEANSPTPAAESTRQAASDAPAPDIVVVLVDTLRADHLSTYGYPRPTSPWLDGVAAEGVVFEDVTAQSSWTLPSMASLFSGKRLFVNAQRMPSTVPSLAERLGAAGYETAGFLGNPAVNPSGAYDRGFDHFIGREQTGGQTWSSRDLERALAGWLDEFPPSDAPRFVYLHYFDPHWPYTPLDDAPLAGEPFVAPDSLSAWEAAERDDSDAARDAEAVRAQMLADIDAYDREIAQMDRSVARSLQRLAASRETPRDTLLVFASDHGEGLWDHREHASLVKDPRSLREQFFRDHSYHMWRELIFTPLVVQGPGFPEGLRVTSPVENIDILPTLLRAAGLPDDPRLDGRALQDLVAQPEPPRLLTAHSNEATSLRRPDNGLQLIFPTDTGFSYGMDIQLYDTSVDPNQRHNLADEIQSVGKDHPRRAELVELLAEHRRLLDGFDLYDGESADNDDADQLETLCQLGYLGDDC